MAASRSPSARAFPQFLPANCNECEYWFVSDEIAIKVNPSKKVVADLLLVKVDANAVAQLVNVELKYQRAMETFKQVKLFREVLAHFPPQPQTSSSQGPPSWARQIFVAAALARSSVLSCPVTKRPLSFTAATAVQPLVDGAKVATILQSLPCCPQ